MAANLERAKLLHREHSKLSYHRKRQGIQQVEPPWDWISSARVVELVKEAYRVAAFQHRPGQVIDGESSDGHLTPGQRRENFAEALVSLFDDRITAEATRAAGVWTRQGAAAAQRIRAQASALPDTWRPQYPQFAPGAEREGGNDVRP